MKAEQLLLHATQSFGSDTTRVIGQAFDEAWAGMAFLSPWSAASNACGLQRSFLPWLHTIVGMSKRSRLPGQS
jgi:hypothetical protein